jgi:hypothetical protein
MELCAYLGYLAAGDPFGEPQVMMMWMMMMMMIVLW